MDKYDEEIGEILHNFPEIKDDEEEYIYDVGQWFDEGYWGNPKSLFQYTDRVGRSVRDYFAYGCLTQVRGNHYRISPFFNEEIKNDNRLHCDQYELVHDLINAKTYEEIVEILLPYAEWQRRIDAEFAKI